MTNEWKLPPEMKWAACRSPEVNPDWWFADFFGTRPEGLGQEQKLAVKICKTCPHALECLRWAMDRPEDYGIWGGVTAKGRANMRRFKREQVKG